jgi:inner membrane protein
VLWRTHFLAGATAGLLVASPGNIESAVATAAVSGFAALLPDIDSPYSKLGRVVPVLPRLLSLTVGHRGILHSFLGAAIVSLLATMFLRVWYGQEFWLLLSQVMAGYISHILLDCLTDSGCPLLYPLPGRYCLPLLNTGSFAEKLIFFPALFVLFAWSFAGFAGVV